MKYLKMHLLDISCFTILVTGVFLVYLLTVKQNFSSSVERGRYALTQAIVQDKSLQIDRYKEFSYPDVSFKNGHYYSRFPAGMSFLVAPIHVVALKFFANNEPILHFQFMALLSALAIGFLYVLGRINKFGVQVSLLGSFVFAFSTLLFSFAGGFWAHIPSYFLVVLGLVFMTKLSQTKKTRYSLLIGFTYGLSISIDFPNALFLSPLCCYVLYLAFRTGKASFLKNIVALLVPITCIAALIVLYNINTFGKPFAIGQSSSVSVGSKFKSTFIPVKNWTSQGVLDDRRLFPGLSTQLISPERGLIMFSPIIILSVLGFFVFYKKQSKVASVLIAIFVLNITFYSIWQDYWGGWSFGPRYLLPVLPVFFIPMLAFIKQYLYNPFLLVLFVLSSFWGIIVNSLGALTGALLPCPCEGYQGFQYSPLLAYNQLFHSNINSYYFNNFLKGVVPLPMVFFVMVFILMIFFGFLTLITPKPNKTNEK